jgi:hypothetical protein
MTKIEGLLEPVFYVGFAPRLHNEEAVQLSEVTGSSWLVSESVQLSVEVSM